MEDIILTCFGTGIGLIFIFKVLILKSEYLEVKSNYEKVNKQKEELEKQNSSIKAINSNFENKEKILMRKILELKGYRKTTRNSGGYIYYEIDNFFTIAIRKLDLKRLYELEQKEEIFPTLESAEKSLLAKIKKEERAKEELKNKYAEEPEEKINFASMSQEQMRTFLDDRYSNGLCGIKFPKGSEEYCRVKYNHDGGKKGERMIGHIVIKTMHLERSLAQNGVPYQLNVSPINESIILTVSKQNETYKAYANKDGVSFKGKVSIGEYFEMTETEFLEKCKNLYCKKEKQ